MKKRTYLRSIFAAVVLILACGLIVWPLMGRGFYVSDDGEWMVIRLSAFYHSLASGQFPVRYLGRLNNSYGYPVANFLYPGFLYIGSVLHVAGFSLVTAVKMILAGSVLAGAGAVFLSLRKRYSLGSSVIGALSFVCSPYLLYDLYHRGSVGEVLAVCAAAIAVLALTRSWAWLFTPAVTLLLISHNTLAVMFGMAFAVLIAVHEHRTRMAVSAALGVFCAAFFWIPALAEKSLVRFDMIRVSDPFAYFIRFDQAELLGFSVGIAWVLMANMHAKKSIAERVIMGCVFVGMLLSTPLSGPVWRLPEVVRLVQFPYRFLALSIVFGPWIVAFVTEHLAGMRRTAFIVLCAVIAVLGIALQFRRIGFVDRAAGYYETNEGTTTVADEYMPRWVIDIPKTRPVETLELIRGDAVVSPRTFAGGGIEAHVDAREMSMVQINKVYYPGWGVTVDGDLVPVDFRNTSGVMRFVVPSGTHRVRAVFRETPMRFAADMLSLLSGVVYIVWIRKIQSIS